MTPPSDKKPSDREPGDSKPSDREDDESSGEVDTSSGEVDNSLGRLLTLSDGVFAIAMTLLTFDLKLPDLGKTTTDSALRHALANETASFLSFVVSFFVVARLWVRHRRLMRAVVASHPRLVRETIYLLFVVASMPFLADLLGNYGSTPIALTLYGLFNGAAILLLAELSRSVRKFELLDHRVDVVLDAYERRDAWRNLFVFALCLPAGYVIGRHGPWVLVLLGVPLRFPGLSRLKKRHQLAAA